MNRRLKVRQGFTLLEVMVSVTILAISLTVLMHLTGNTLIASGRAERMTIATMLARQKMTEIEIQLAKDMKRGEFPEERSEDGEFDEPFDDFRWKMEIRKVELPAPVTGEKGSIQDMVSRQLTKEIARSVRELALTVSWGELGEEQSVEVTTHIVKL